MTSDDALIPDRTPITRLGVLGGTFDPPHYGHLLLADTARVQLGLDLVLFAPVGQPPHKAKGRPACMAHRVALVQAALADAKEPSFVLSRVDVDRPGPHYTVDALTILRQTYQRAQLWFLIGADSLVDLPKWRSPGQIITLARLAALPRPGYDPDWEALANSLAVATPQAAADQVQSVAADLCQRVDWLAGPALDVSSSALRARARRGLPLRFLVPPSVEAYVRAHDLYGAARNRRDRP